MPKKRVVLTGAAGYIAQRMYAILCERWDIVALDVTRIGHRAGDQRRAGGLV
jgi:nucleoside-diphosphate-sugar epimerase